MRTPADLQGKLEQALDAAMLLAEELGLNLV